MEALREAEVRDGGGLFIRYRPDGTGTPDYAPRDTEGQVAIILERQFADLRISDSAFEVTLWFDGMPARLNIPFASVTAVEDRESGVALFFKGDSKPQYTTPTISKREPANVLEFKRKK